MNINWKIRFKNPLFWAQIVLAVLSPIMGVTQMSFADLTSWYILGELLKFAVSSPYVWGLVAISVFNAITDPTTTGIGDSQRALTYESPYKDETARAE